MIVTSVQIKTAKTQKHLYCLVFTGKVSGFSPVPFFCIMQKGERDSNSSSIFLQSKKGHKINCSQSEHDGLKTRRVSPSAPGKVSGFSPVPFFCIMQKGERDSNSSSIFLQSKKGHKINCSQSEHDGLKTRRVSPSAPGKVSGFSPVPFFCIMQKGERDSNSSSIFLQSKKGHKINCSQSEHDGLKTRRVSPSAPGKVSGFSPVPFFCIMQKG